MLLYLIYEIKRSQNKNRWFMKQVIMKRLLIAGIAFLTVPALAFAQDNKEKEKKDKDKKEKSEVKQIIITRSGDKDEKMTIVVDGDKVTVNGKDLKDLKDADDHVNTFNLTGIYSLTPVRTWNFDFDMDDHFSLFSEDENRAMLGVTTEGHDKGAEVKSITKESAAEKAGLKKGDVLTKIDNQSIESTDDVTKAIRAHKPGDKINITYLRDGKEQKATAELGKWKGIKMNAVTMPRIADTWQLFTPEPPMAFGQGGNNFFFSGRPKLGISIQDTDDGAGVKVLEVDEESAAAKAGIKKDDIIVSVDEEEVKGTEDVTRAIRGSRDKTSFTFKVKRDGKTQNIEVKIPKKLKTADL
jgi:serine protease Do